MSKREARRFAILGNSGSGKSTLAAALARVHQAPTLDLDTVAWVPGRIAVPREPAKAEADVRRFCSANPAFVIEGCYESLVAASFAFDPHLLFLDPGVDACERHCRSRPFEPHKYDSIAAQNEKLAFLLDWVRGYYTRTGPMSRMEHIRLYDSYAGSKSRFMQEVSLDDAGDIVVS